MFLGENSLHKLITVLVIRCIYPVDKSKSQLLTANLMKSTWISTADFSGRIPSFWQLILRNPREYQQVISPVEFI